MHAHYIKGTKGVSMKFDGALASFLESCCEQTCVSVATIIPMEIRKSLAWKTLKPSWKTNFPRILEFSGDG